jgi:Tol biopolymer transport system component
VSVTAPPIPPRFDDRDELRRIERDEQAALIEEARRRTRRRRLWYGASALFAAGAGLAAFAGLGGGSGPTPMHPAPAGSPAQAGEKPAPSRIAFGAWRNVKTTIYTMNADGTGLRKVMSPNLPAWPALSPNGRRIAVQIGYQSTRAIYVMRADGGARHLLVRIRGGLGERPSWSPDGTRIAYSGCDGLGGICVVNADGTGQHSLTRRGYSPAWSPDGTKIAYSGCAAAPPVITGLCVMNADGTGRHLLAPVGGAPVWSPDGTTIAYLSGFPDVRVYLMNADGSEQRRLPPHINYKNQDCNLAWSPDGTRIAFTPDITPDGGIYLMNTSGKGVVRLKGTTGGDGCGISWQRIAPPTR